MLQELLGHRGAAGEAPENTITGFQHAWEVGVRSFELDIRISSDHQLVVLHDESLLRTAGIDRKVWEVSAPELAEIETLMAFPKWPKKTGVPRLNDVLELFGSQAISWELEIKNTTKEKMEMISTLLVRMIAEFDLQERVVITSFVPEALFLMSRLTPNLRRGFISRYDKSEDLKTAQTLGCYRTCIPLRDSKKETVKEAHAMGFNVTGWLGDSAEMIGILLDWDVDAITTNQPTLAIDYLRQHNITIPGIS